MQHLLQNNSFALSWMTTYVDQTALCRVRTQIANQHLLLLVAADNQMVIAWAENRKQSRIKPRELLPDVINLNFDFFLLFEFNFFRVDLWFSHF